MIRSWINSFGSTLYVQIWSTRIKVTNIRSGQVFDDQPVVALTIKGNKKRVDAIGSKAKQLLAANTELVNPFMHPRVLFADFAVGEELLKHIINVVCRKHLIRQAPTMVIHAMEKTEGGLTMIERRAFMELGHGAGARYVEVYEGAELSLSGFEEAFKTRQLNSM